MRFPELLWSLVNECKSGAIAWSKDGDSVLFDYVKFKEEYMKDITNFKTTNIASFVRQLNLYGFRKYQKPNMYGIKLHEFFHPLFIRGRQDLMNKMKRKSAYSSKKKFFSESSIMQKDYVDKDHVYKKDKKPRRTKPETSSSAENTLDSFPTPVRHIQPTSSMEQMQKFMFNNPLAGSNIANKNMPGFLLPQSWMNPAFFNPGNWNRNVLGGIENLNRNFPRGFGNWNINVPEGTGNWNRNVPGSSEMWNNVPGSTGNGNDPEGTENDENRLYSNLMRGYPVLKRGEGNAHYLIMPGYGPYGGMYPNPDFYMNTMPISGMPIKKDSNEASDKASEEECIIH
ncbi:hypothetical protein JTE90_019986 [Oedothorax gibbosus]|uniref:HSF-type DNA-binding domain-containing protein n=1 Tax=Oedothorax gibbosus TaxID=931172 RepID=A0AAV6UF49_9ARAC|nr:hypothetical protein JTE90_019986 [Oedothorax gibbosus]